MSASGLRQFTPLKVEKENDRRTYSEAINFQYNRNLTVRIDSR